MVVNYDDEIREGKRQVASFCRQCHTPVTWAEAQRAYHRLLKANAPDGVLKGRMHFKCAGLVVHGLAIDRDYYVRQG